MPDDVRETVNEIGGAAEMAAFCVPGYGEIAAAVIAGGLAIFNLVYDDDEEGERSAAATQADLDAAVDSIKAAISDQAIRTKLDDIHSKINDYNRTLASAWDDLKNENDILELMQIDSPLAQSTVDHYKLLKEPILDYNSDFYHGMNVIIDLDPLNTTELKDFRLEVIYLHMHAVNTFILYAKFFLMWEHRELIANDPKLDDLRSYLKKNLDNKALKKQTMTWAKTYGAAARKAKREKKSLDEAGIPAPPIEAALIKQSYRSSAFVNAIHFGLIGVEDNDMAVGYLAALETIQKQIKAAYDAFDKREKKAEDRVVVARNNDILVDGRRVGHAMSRELADMQRDALVGEFVEQAWQEEIIDTDMLVFDKEFQDLLGGVVENWQQVKRDIVQFVANYTSAIDDDEEAKKEA